MWILSDLMLKLYKPSVRLLFLVLLLAAICFSYFQTSANNTAESATTKKWYVHGLIYQNAFDRFQQELLPYDIQLVSKGCIIGGDEYQKDIRNNQQIYESSPDGLKLLLGEPKSRV